MQRSENSGQSRRRLAGDPPQDATTGWMGDIGAVSRFCLLFQGNESAGTKLSGFGRKTVHVLPFSCPSWSALPISCAVEMSPHLPRTCDHCAVCIDPERRVILPPGTSPRSAGRQEIATFNEGASGCFGDERGAPRERKRGKSGFSKH